MEANRSVHTAKVMQLARESHFFLFEPAAATINRLKPRFKSAINVTIMPMALSNSHGKATLSAEASGAETGTMALAHRHDFPTANDHLETIRTARIDCFWSELTSSSQGLVDDAHGLSSSTMGPNASIRRPICLTSVIFFHNLHLALYRITRRGPMRITAYSPRKNQLSPPI